MRNSLTSCTALLFFSNVTFAAPTVTGNTISWPDDGWYQVQDQATHTEVCGGGSSCNVEPGTYVVINHSTGERINDITVVGDGGPTNGVTVTNNTISWPDDGWYQVQDQATHTEVCGGGRYCNVESGTYVVINHSTGERFNDIMVVGDGGPTNGVTVTGNTISWPDDDWYQVQDSIDYESLCEGGISCDVPPGSYVVINHSTGERFRNIVVEASEQSTAIITLDNHVELLENIFAIYSGKLYGDELINAPDYSDPTYNGRPLNDVQGNLISTSADVACSNGGTASFVPEIDSFYHGEWAFQFDNCQDGASVFDGDLLRGVFESVTIESSGFTHDDQTQTISFSGGVYHDNYVWSAFGLNLSLVRSDSYLNINNSTTSFEDSCCTIVSGHMSGRFEVRANWTGNQTIIAQVTQTFDLLRNGTLLDSRITLGNVGELELRVGLDNMLVLDADTGDSATVSVTVVADGVSETVIQDWSLWGDELNFRPNYDW